MRLVRRAFWATVWEAAIGLGAHLGAQGSSSRLMAGIVVGNILAITLGVMDEHEPTRERVDR